MMRWPSPRGVMPWSSLASAVLRCARLHRRLLVCAGAVVSAMAIWTYVQLTFGRPGDINLEGYRELARDPIFSPRLGLSLMATVGPILAIVMSAVIMDGLLRWRMMAHEVAHHGRRMTVGSRLALVWASSVLLTAVAVVVCLLASIATGGNKSGGHLPAVSGSPFGVQVLVVILGWSLWGTVAAVVTLVLRNATLGIVLPIGYAFIETIAVPAFAGSQAILFPASAQVATLQMLDYLPPGTTIISAPTTAPVAGATAGVAVTVIYVLLLTVWVTRHMARVEVK